MIARKPIIFAAILLLAVIVVIAIFLRGGTSLEGAAEKLGFLPASLKHPAAPNATQVVHTDANLTANETAILGNFTLYDGFTSERADTWTKPGYKPKSSFIDTTFLPSNVEFANGDLILRSDANLHQGSEYKTLGKFLYGKYRASIRASQTPGTYMAFFVYTPDPDDHNEIDIELIKTGNVSKVIFTTWVRMKKNEQTFVLGFDPSQDYHVYGFDWHPDRVDFYIDDMATPVCTSTSMVPQGQCYLYLNNWVVTRVPQEHGDGVNTMYVDWVTVEPQDAE